MALHVVRLYKCPAAGDVVDHTPNTAFRHLPPEVCRKPLFGVWSSMCPSIRSLLTSSLEILQILYCRVFLHFTVVPVVLELSVGFGHVVRRVLNHHSPSLVCGADPDNPLGDHFSELAQCCSTFWTQVVMATSRTLVDVCATL